MIHSVTLALNPGMVRTEQVRDLAFDADGTLHLSAPERGRRGEPVRHHRLHWQRHAGAPTP